MDKEIEKASKFTKKEIDFINKIGEEIFSAEQRNFVYIALCSHIIGNIEYYSKGVLSKEKISELILMGVESIPTTSKK